MRRLNIKGGNKHLQTKVLAPLISLGLALGATFLASATVAATGANLYVGHGSLGSDTSCASPGYNSVQAAINAAPLGGTVYLCGAPFAQQVFVNKSINLTGDSTSGLTAVGTTFTTSQASYPAQFTSGNLFTPQALLVEEGSGTSLSVSNLNFSGAMSGNGGCADEEYGILALAGNLNLNDDQVTNVADSNSSLYGCQFGVGIEIGAAYWPTATFSAFPNESFAAKANMNGVSVSGYQKNGITVDGVGSTANINGSKVTGGGAYTPFGEIIAQNGIQISNGANANIANTAVANNAYVGSGYASSTGILIYGGYGAPLTTGVNISNNTLTNNDIGIALVNYNSAGSGPATSPTKENVAVNHISDSAVTNTSGECNGAAVCGGTLIGYQAGIADVGYGDNIAVNFVSGQGYASQGEYVYNPTGNSTFTQTGPNAAFVRPIDAGGSFPTTDANVHVNFYDGHLLSL